MVTQPASAPEKILERIDLIMRELTELRKVVAQREAGRAESGLARKLYGSLGQGSWDECERDLDWERFAE